MQAVTRAFKRVPSHEVRAMFSNAEAHGGYDEVPATYLRCLRRGIQARSL